MNGDYKKLFIDVISCDNCRTKYIKKSSKNKTCDKCYSPYCFHMIGEVIKLDKKDYEILSSSGKILLDKKLMMKYNLRNL